MKRLMILSAATLAAVQAHAADLPVRVAPPVALPVPFTWTGFYIGGQLGYIHADRGRVAFPSTDTDGGGYPSGQRSGAIPTTAKFNDDGVAGGGQIGYNMQFNRIVAGVEADISATSLDETRFFNLTGNGATLPVQTTLTRRLDYLGTVRGRLGYTFDQTLVYVTGGFAYGETMLRLGTVSLTAAPPLLAGATSRKMLTGSVIGGGIEYALNASWTVKAEYLHYDLARQSVTNFYQYGANSSTLTARTRNDGYLARVGVNYKFNLF